MIKIQSRYKNDLLRWLHENVASNQPCMIPDRLTCPEDVYTIPYHVSTTVQIASWQGYGRRWQVHQAARYNGVLVVECQDPEIETYIATRWG